MPSFSFVENVLQSGWNEVNQLCGPDIATFMVNGWRAYTHIYVTAPFCALSKCQWIDRAMDQLGENGRHLANDTFKSIFLNENILTSVSMSPKFVPQGQINNIPALVQLMAWRRPGDKPLYEPMMVSILMHICVNHRQRVNEKET